MVEVVAVVKKRSPEIENGTGSVNTIIIGPAGKDLHRQHPRVHTQTVIPTRTGAVATKGAATRS